MSSTKRWWRLNGPLPRTSLLALVAVLVALEVAWEEATTILAMAKATQVLGVVGVLPMVGGETAVMGRLLERGGVVMGATVQQAMELQAMVALVAMVQE